MGIGELCYATSRSPRNVDKYRITRKELRQCLSSFSLYIFFICQSIGDLTSEINVSFALEKCLHPMKPRVADKGDGCAAVKI